MSVNPAVEGRTYRTADEHRVTRAELAAFADAVRAQDPIHHDAAAAQRAGYSDVVATPTFAVTLAQQAEALFLQDPDAGVDFSRLVHGEESFVHHTPITAGDALVAEARVKRVRSAGGHDMVTLETVVETAAGDPRSTTTSVMVIRRHETPA